VIYLKGQFEKKTTQNVKIIKPIDIYLHLQIIPEQSILTIYVSINSDHIYIIHNIMNNMVIID
jgi:hypothetical protein